MLRLVLFLVIATQFARTSTLYESAPVPEFWIGGLCLLPEQFVGARFELPLAADITAIGTAINTPSADAEFFAALVALPSVTAFPSDVRGVPFENPPLWTGVFTVPPGGSEVEAALTLRLPRGAYALVFGTGLFGSRSSPGYIVGSPKAYPASDIIIWYDITGSQAFSRASWFAQHQARYRVVVHGTFVPEPSTWVLVGLPTGVLLFRRYRGRASSSSIAAFPRVL